MCTMKGTIAGAASFAGALAMVLLVLSCERKNEYVAPPPPLVTVAQPAQKSVTEFADFNGLTEASEFVEIRARVEGYLESILFQPGARVKQGDLLMIIDPKPFQAKLDEAKAELARRQAELKQTDATLQRKELAFKANAVSEVEVIQARADRDVAKANIQAAQAAIETAQLNLSYTRIHAPISGRIGRDLVDEGNLVGASERTLLTTIVQDDPIYAYFTVNERDFLHYQQHPSRAESPTNVKANAKVYLGLSNQKGYPFEGYVDFVNNRLDASTGTIQIRGVFVNPEQKVWPGLFARIRVPVGVIHDALMVPDSAIGVDQRGEYVLLLGPDNIVQYRSVKIGLLDGGLRVVEQGLSPDDRVIVEGLQRARPGLTVTPMPADQAADPQAASQNAQ